MFSKTVELAGLGMVAVGIAMLLGTAAGIIFGGASLVLIGTTTDDQAVGAAIRRRGHYIRYLWQRQVLRENGVALPNLGIAKGWIACGCANAKDCPVCGGLGYVPDPNHQANPNSPHPPIKVDPQTEAFWSRMATARIERSKLRDRTQALSRHDREEFE